MGVQRKASHTFKHLILQHEILCVSPVIRQFGRGVVAHDVMPGDAWRKTLAAGRPGQWGHLVRAGAAWRAALLIDETVHFRCCDAIIQVRHGGQGEMRAAGVHVTGIVERRHATLGRLGGVQRHAGAGGNPLAPG